MSLPHGERRRHTVELIGDVPPPHSGWFRERFVDALVAEPYEWFLVQEMGIADGSYVRDHEVNTRANNLRRTWGERGFEFAVRSTTVADRRGEESRRIRLYARFAPPTDRLPTGSRKTS